MIHLKKGQLPIFLSGLLLVLIFTILAFNKRNYEFVMYIAVIVFFFLLILWTNKKNNFSNLLLWGLLGWATLHMVGGLIFYKGAVVYAWVVFEFFRNSDFVILRYDQVVHCYGFFIATFVGYSLLKPYLNNKINWKVLGALIALIGMGLGVINEIVEFVAVLVLPETGVGGYYNTLWDLVFNTIGAVVAGIIISFKE